MRHPFSALALAAAMIVATPVLGDGDALVIDTAEYERLPRLGGGPSLPRIVAAFETAGFEVSSGRDQKAAAMRDTFERFLSGVADDDGDLAVVLSGRFAHGAGSSHVLPVDADRELDSFAVLTRALPLDAVLAVLAARPGRAVLFLAEGDSRGISGRFVTGGVGPLEVPQGVTVIRGPRAEVLDFASLAMARPGGRIVGDARRAGLTVEGYAPELLSFPAAPVDPAREGAAEAPEQAPDEQAGQARESVLWANVRGRDEPQGYRDYLAAFPDGVHAVEARARIAAIEADPFFADRKAEEALNLDREARRAIQRQLSLLDFDTRGIDGIFGNGTRGAINRWQAANAERQTGFLTADQIARIDAQAARRTAELEAEAERRRVEQERRDRAFWAETGARGDEAGLRAYLTRFPDGVFAELAQGRLDAILAQQRSAAEERDRAAWDIARGRDTVQAYRSYLETFPRGGFAEAARARIEELRATDADRQALARAEAQEQSLQLNPAARRLVEARLDALKLNPGEVDGTFDRNTRRAIRRYQTARGLPVTGFLDQATAVRLLADTVLR